MNLTSTSLPLRTAGLLTGTALLVALTGCVTEGPGRPVVHRGPPSVVVQATLGYEDDYDYYPGYEVYYSRNRREYVYRDGGQWVRRTEPRGVSLSVLLAAPSVRVDFRDSPERHHDAVIRSYPRTWRRPGPAVQVQASVAIEDDYDYYPAHEVYYSRTRHEYVYREGSQWVRRSEPRGVPLTVLRAAPSVRVEFRDSPERHHDAVIRTYPKNWKRQNDKDDRREDKNDRHDDKKDEKKDK